MLKASCSSPASSRRSRTRCAALPCRPSTTCSYSPRAGRSATAVTVGPPVSLITVSRRTANVGAVTTGVAQPFQSSPNRSPGRQFPVSH